MTPGGSEKLRLEQFRAEFSFPNSAGVVSLDFHKPWVEGTGTRYYRPKMFAIQNELLDELKSEKKLQKAWL